MLLFDWDYVNLKKLFNLNIFCLVIVCFDCYYKVESVCLFCKVLIMNVFLLNCGICDWWKGKIGIV